MCMFVVVDVVFFFKQKTAYEMRISDWSSDVCSSDLLPDSYSYDRGERRQAVLDRMQRAMKETMSELWPRRSKDAVVKTPEEALTLASIVEKETGVPSERRMVAGVYSNRLREGMRQIGRAHV